MKLSDFDYPLPEHLIAQEPAPERDQARLLVLDRASGSIQHRIFREIPAFLRPGDLLVLNDTQVVAARLYGQRQTGGKVEALLVAAVSRHEWQCLLQPGGRLHPGEPLAFEDGRIKAVLHERHAEEGWLVRFDLDRDALQDALDHIGHMPLPPYIRRDGGHDPRGALDRERYQTVFAREPGAIAAPTAGLHFTPDILDALRMQGTDVRYITLHVGLGTFKPVKTDDPRTHPMHAEYYTVPGEVAEAANRALVDRRRIVAVGTTTCRALETAAASGEVRAGSGWTSLFICPGYEFRVVQAMVTNFHLPRSTLLMLVGAFAGRDRILRVYEDAIAREYRFFSYGDAMLIL